MLGNILGTDNSERRPSAELLLIQRRLAEIDLATRSEHNAELRRFPDLFTAKAAVAPSPTVEVSHAVASNVINMAAYREAKTMTEQEQRVAHALALTAEAHGEPIINQPVARSNDELAA